MQYADQSLYAAVLDVPKDSAEQQQVDRWHVSERGRISGISAANSNRIQAGRRNRLCPLAGQVRILFYEERRDW